MSLSSLPLYITPEIILKLQVTVVIKAIHIKCNIILDSKTRTWAAAAYFGSFGTALPGQNASCRGLDKCETLGRFLWNILLIFLKWITTDSDNINQCVMNCRPVEISLPSSLHVIHMWPQECDLCTKILPHQLSLIPL